MYTSLPVVVVVVDVYSGLFELTVYIYMVVVGCYSINLYFLSAAKQMSYMGASRLNIIIRIRRRRRR